MTWELFKFRYGHAPDLPPTNPDAWRIYGAMPLSSGISTCHPFEEVTAASTMSGTFCGGIVTQTNEGVTRYFYGMSSSIQEWNGITTITDRSDTTYTASTTATWSFAQFGSMTLAINKNTKLRQISTGADFAEAHTSAPSGSVVTVAGPSSLQFVIVGGYNDGTATPDGWYASPTPTSSWATSIANSIVKARLINPPGPITAMVPFRDGVIAFKKDSMWLGRYVGGTFIWDFKCIAYDIGCVGKRACVNAGEQLYFVGPRGFYVFDGSYPRQIPGFVHETWAQIYAGDTEPSEYADYITANYDPEFANVIFHMTVDLDYGAASSTDALNPGFDRQPQLSYTYNIKSGLWTHSVQSVSVVAGGTEGDVVALIGPRHGITGNQKPTVFKRTATNYAIGYIKTPRFGGIGTGTVLKGFWPNWQVGKTRFGAVMGPSLPSSNWQGPSPIAYFTSYNDLSGLNSYAPVPTNNPTYARLEGMVTGSVVAAETSFGYALGPAEFDGVYLDLERVGSQR